MQPSVLYKVIRYSTKKKQRDGTQVEKNFDQPKSIEAELNRNARDGYEVLYAWNTHDWIVLLLCKDTGVLSPNELAAAKQYKISRMNSDFELTNQEEE